MKDLTNEQILYLLYARAYQDEDGTITKGTVKARLPKAIQAKANSIYEALENLGLIVYARRYRFSVTGAGHKSLVEGLGKTDYRFTSSKGYKVTNELLVCIQKACESEEAENIITDAEFETIFRKQYLEERKSQAENGVEVVKKGELFKRISAHYILSINVFAEYFEKLKKSGKISVFKGRDDEIIEWVE
ncbi:hypothetical protein [Adonisia turfae]|nr:hypothetical protein [Adonisia turfae]